MNYTKTTRRKKSTTKILNHIWIHTLLAVVKTDTCIYAFSSLESQEQKSSQPIYKLRQTGRWTNQAATHLSVQGQTHRPSNYPPFWWRTDIHRLRSHPPFWRRTDTQTDPSATHLSDEGQMDWLSSHPPFWQRTDTQIDWTATHLSDEGQTDWAATHLSDKGQTAAQAATNLSDEGQRVDQAATNLSDEGQRADQAATHRQTKHPPTFLTNRERTKQRATHTQTDRWTDQAASHPQTDQAETHLSDQSWRSACLWCRGRRAWPEWSRGGRWGRGCGWWRAAGGAWASAAGSESGAPGPCGRWPAPGSALGSASLPCSTPAFPVGVVERRGKKRGGNILWQPKRQAVCRLQLSEPSPRCKV